MPSIAILDAGTLRFDDESAWRSLATLGQLAIHPRTACDTASVVAAAKDAEVVLSNKVPLTREVILQLPQLKLISVLATGYNNVDLQTAAEHGITVCNVPSYSSESVAQHTLALILELLNHIGEHNQLVQKGEWVAETEFCFWRKPVIELRGQTVGILGWGEIGRRVGELVHAFGANLLAFSRSQRHTPTWETGFRWGSVDEIFAQSDILSLHCPQTPETEGIVSRERLASMKPGARLINTSRGGLVDEVELADALRSGHLAGAAIDVVSKEPMIAGHPLLDAPNCIITPHMAWGSEPSRLRMVEISRRNIEQFLAGSPVNVVSQP